MTRWTAGRPVRAPGAGRPGMLARGLRDLTRPPGFRRNLWLVLLATFLVFVGIGIQTVILNLYLVGLGFAADYLGLFSFANTAAIGGAAFAAGALTHRVPTRLVLLGAVAGAALSMGGLVATADGMILLALSVGNGVALAHVFVPIAPFLMDNARADQRPAAFAGYFAAQALASMVGSLVGGLLPRAVAPDPGALEHGYLITLIAAAVVTGLGCVPLALADDSTEEGSRTSRAPEPDGAVARRQVRRDLAWMVSANGLVAASTGFAIPFVNVFFDQQLGASTATIGAVFALASAAMALGSLLGPPAGRWVGPVGAVVLGRTLVIPLLVGLGLAPDALSGAALYVVRTFLFNLTWPVDNAFAMELVTTRLRATLAALRSTSWNLGWSVASAAAGAVIVHLGFTVVFLASAALLAVGNLVYFVGFRGRQLSAGVEPPVTAPRLEV